MNSPRACKKTLRKMAWQSKCLLCFGWSFVSNYSMITLSAVVVVKGLLKVL